MFQPGYMNISKIIQFSSSARVRFPALQGNAYNNIKVMFYFLLPGDDFASRF